MKTTRKLSRTVIGVAVAVVLSLMWVGAACAQPGMPPGPPGMGGGHMRPPPPPPLPELLTGVGVLLIGIAMLLLAGVAWQGLKLARQRLAAPQAPVAPVAPCAPAETETS